MYPLTIIALLLCYPIITQANPAHYETLSASTQIFTQQEINDIATTNKEYVRFQADAIWLTEMSKRLESFKPDQHERESFLRTVYYEAMRAGLDPQLVLSVIHIESGFRKYALSQAGARGYMQIMPFWTKAIGEKNHNLFHLRVNLRYGCMILRHYLNQENGNYYRALGRYNGSLGRTTYPKQVFNLWRNDWFYLRTTA